jgi:hypothetical protein
MFPEPPSPAERPWPDPAKAIRGEGGEEIDPAVHNRGVHQLHAQPVRHGAWLHKPALRALAFARADCLDVLEAVAMATDEQETQELAETWQQHGIWCRSQCWKLS